MRSFDHGSLELPSISWIVKGLPFWLFKGGFNVSSGTLSWYRSSYGTDFDNSETPSFLVGPC